MHYLLESSSVIGFHNSDIHLLSIYIIENVSERLPTPSPHPAGAHLWWGKGPDGGPDGGHDGGHHF